MLLSLALTILVGLILSSIMQKIRLPGLIGMLLTGVILGPYVLNLIAPEMLAISADLRQIALIVILTRAGLSLDIKDLQMVGRPAVLMCFIPATFEIAATIVLAPLILPMSYLEAAIMGTVIAAVSPAVVVPGMLKIMKKGYGRTKGIPKLIMAGASVDDIYVIVLFTSLLSVYNGENFSLFSLLKIPVMIISGLLAGVLAGLALIKLFKQFHLRDTVKVLILLSCSFLLVSLEKASQTVLPMSGLLAVIALGATVRKEYSVLASRLSGKYAKIWVAAELMLFVLIGATVDIRYAAGAGFHAILLIATVLVARMGAVFISLAGTKLNARERLFCALAYLPKATVQAAIGALPLAAGVEAGKMILTVAVVSVLLTAPLGAVAIDLTYKRLLTVKHGIHQR